MSLSFAISPASDIPIFRHVVEQIHQAVALGRLRVGEQLPAVRVLAETLVVNPNTIARAYQELIREGILESRAGRGVFVAEKRQVFSDAERLRRLEQAAGQLCHEGMLFGSSLTEIKSVLDARWKELQREIREGNPPTERKK